MSARIFLQHLQTQYILSYLNEYVEHAYVLYSIGQYLWVGKNMGKMSFLSCSCCTIFSFKYENN